MLNKEKLHKQALDVSPLNDMKHNKEKSNEYQYESSQPATRMFARCSLKSFFNHNYPTLFS